MNIVFTYITPFHPNRGGIGRVTHTLAHEFLRRGHKVYYLIYESSITLKHEYDYPAQLDYFPSKILLSQDNISFYHNYLRKYKIDIVINQSGNFNDSFLYLETEKRAKVISVLHSVPSIAYKYLWHDIYPLKNNSFIEKLKRIARIVSFPIIKYRFYQSRKEHFNALLPRTDYVCTLSPKFFEEMSSYCSGYEYKYISIPNPNSYSNQELRHNFDSRKKQVLYSGLLVKNKRVDRIIKIWRRIEKDYPEWNLVVLGSGDVQYVSMLKELAAGSSTIHFAGFQNPLSYYQESSILCLTSNYEGWPMCITEAMQCGAVPVLFDSFETASEIVKNNETGILVNPFKLKEMENKLRMLMSDELLLSRMSIAAQNDVKRFSVEIIANYWETIFVSCEN